MAEKIDLIDGHGITYRYAIMTKDALFSDDSGVFVFAKPNEHGWTPIYVGHCSSFRQHIPSDTRWAEAAKMGASSIFTTLIEDPKECERHAYALAALLEPDLNVKEAEEKAAAEAAETDTGT